MTYAQMLDAHLADAKDYIDRYFTIASFGSMNYGLNDENSDFDTKMIIIPSLRDVCLSKPLVSTVIVRDNDEHIEVKDLRLIDKSWRKQGLSSIELLFAPYYKTTNAVFWDFGYRKEREAIAHINPYSLAKNIGGLALNEFKKMTHATPARQAITEKYGYDGKCVSHLLRLEDLLSRYLKDIPMAECLLPKQKDLLMNYKHQLPTAENALKDAQTSLAAIDTLIANVKPSNSNPRTLEYLDDMLYDILRKG